jgi:hypothetical protein
MVHRLEAVALAIFLCLILGSPRTVAAEDKNDSGFREAMIEFLTIQDAAQAIEDQMTYGIAQQTLSSIAASGIEITEPMQIIVVEVARTSVGSKVSDINYLTDLYTPIYAEIYSESELRELNAFWTSPIGKKTIAAMPKLTEGSQLVLQQASTQFIPDFQTTVEKQLAEAGIILAPVPAPAEPN